MKSTDHKGLQVHQDINVKEAMRRMDKTGLKILFVTGTDGRLVGTITDGDFRRWILAGKSLESDISALYNKDPIKVRAGYDIEEVKGVLVEKRIEAVPVVDGEGRITDALFWEEVFGEKYSRPVKKVDLPVAIMAGGLGSRFSTVTKILPKPLIPFGDKPIVEVIMDNFSSFGCGPFYLLLGYKGLMIQSYFDNANSGHQTVFKFEDGPSGTAGALRMLEGEVPSDSLFVTNCDILIKADYADIFSFHKKNRCDITVVSAMKHVVVPYGVMEITTGGKMQKLTEKPEYDLWVNTGMYVINRKVISLVPASGEFHFTDLIEKTREGGGKVGVYPISEKSWFDIGQPSLWEESDSRYSISFKKENNSSKV